MRYVGDFLAWPWAAEAARLGWTELDLYGVDADRPYVRIDGFGLLPVLNDGRIVAMTADVAILETPGGARQSYRRQPDRPGRVPVWEIGS